MSRRCSLTGKQVQFGHNVSHSNRKTNRRFQVNLQKVSLVSEALGRAVPLRVSTRALRTVQKRGGLDAFLLGTDDARLPELARRLKRRIQKRMQARG
ncbi:MAG: 50S ribosomal protein L28 [Myxococcota bacterium]|jgi:large subunit ribosomal protein L28